MAVDEPGRRCVRPGGIRSAVSAADQSVPVPTVVSMQVSGPAGLPGGERV